MFKIIMILIPRIGILVVGHIECFVGKSFLFLDDASKLVSSSYDKKDHKNLVLSYSKIGDFSISNISINCIVKIHNTEWIGYDGWRLYSWFESYKLLLKLNTTKLCKGILTPFKNLVELKIMLVNSQSYD